MLNKNIIKNAPMCRLLKMKVPKCGFCSNAIEEPFLVSRTIFQRSVLKIKNILIVEENNSR